MKCQRAVVGHMFPQDVFLDHELDNKDQKAAAPDEMMIARVLYVIIQIF